MRFYGLLLALFLSTQLSAQGIEFFDGTWKEAIALAEKEDKIVFVDAYAKWCGPCKRMSKNVFTQAEVGDFYNKNFINLKLDMEEADGMSFGSKYPVAAFPTLFYLDVKGEIIKKVTGGQQAPQLISLGEAAIKSWDRSGEFETLYEEGKRDYELMVSYVRELNKVEKPSLKISNEYIKSNPDITSQQKALFLLEAVTESDSKLFDQLIALKDEAIKGSSKEKFEQKIHSVAMATVAKAVEFDYAALVDESIEQYKKAGVGNKDKFELEAHMEYHKLSGDYAQWKTTSDKFLKKFAKKDPSLYKKQIATISKDFKHISESSDYAEEIYKSLLKKDDALENYSAYVQLLILNKKNEEAIKVTKTAMKKAKSKGEDVTKFERTLDYLNSI